MVPAMNAPCPQPATQRPPGPENGSGVSSHSDAALPCFHGGAFFEAIGEGFQSLERRHDIINADVLDAWFPPSPRVTAVLRDHLDWLVRTSPPVDARGLVEAVARARGVPIPSLLPGAGSSDLIYLALRHWLSDRSRVLILDPTYGEYHHVLEHVIGCGVDHFWLHRAERYDVDVTRFQERLRQGYDLVVLVNPNSPTGRCIPRFELEELARNIPRRTRLWIDETYVDYTGPGSSLETLAAASENVIVCKSMSKVYALSGVRAAYLCANERQLAPLRVLTPPWAVSLPAQVAAVHALLDPAYYRERYRQTHRLRDDLFRRLERLNLEAVPGLANFLLVHLPETGPDAATVVEGCREHGLFLRDASVMSRRLGHHLLRIAVKDGETNARMADILGQVLTSARGKA
jgi:histidinol-phosphate/aromatic aminotransferase/cobyric acid decarboxylase-like protein